MADARTTSRTGSTMTGWARMADYLFGRAMDGMKRQGWRRAILLTSISMNLGILCYFKYRGWFLNELYDTLRAFGYDPGYGKMDLARVIDRVNYRDVLSLLIKKYFTTDLDASAVFDWLEEIAELSGDPKLVSRVQEDREKCLIQR